MSQAPQMKLLDEQESKKIATTISDRLSQELVIALVGPVGSGVSISAEYLTEILSQTFDYDVAPTIKPSGIIRAEASRVAIVIPDPNAGRDAYIDTMQTAGNKLREKFGSNYLAEKAIEKIVTHRRDKGGYNEKDIVLPGRRAYRAYPLGTYTH